MLIVKSAVNLFHCWFIAFNMPIRHQEEHQPSTTHTLKAIKSPCLVYCNIDIFVH